MEEISMRYAELLDIVQLRAEQLGIKDPATDRTDSAVLEIYIHQALIDISEMADVPALMRNDALLFVTESGVNTYQLPMDWGRLIMPRVRNRRGIYLYDGIQQFDLEHTDPNVLARQYSSTLARPRQFTVVERQLMLFPTPDNNSGLNYTIKGVYVVRQERPNLDDEVRVPYPGMLIDLTLYRAAADLGKSIQSLAEAKVENMARLGVASR
jgi:hypothetical protein